MIITLSGIDGSGKTHHSTELFKELTSSGIPVRYIHMMNDPYDYTIIRCLLRLVRKAHLGVTAPKGEVQTIVPKNIIVRTLWPLVALLDFLVTFLIRIRPLAKNTVLICDRYYYDYLASFHALGVASEWSFALFMRFVPKPDQCYFLDSDVDLAFKRRKGTLSLEYLRKLREAYFKIIQALDPKPQILNTSRNQSFVSSHIFEDVRALLAKI